MSTTIVKDLTRGHVSSDQYKAYMSDVYCYALHSSQVIALAGARMVLSHPPLAQYLFRHAEEELGHDKWAASDLHDLGMSSAEVENILPSSPCIRMIGFEYFYAAHANPVGLFGWMFVLESLGGKSGSGIAQAVDTALNLGGKGTYFLRGHGDADAQHSKDLCSVIEENVKSPEDVKIFLYTVAESESLYHDILDNAMTAQSGAAEPVGAL
ncbi:MAG: iron-containing redox enzyme family protein [Terriglobales bacterium]